MIPTFHTTNSCMPVGSSKKKMLVIKQLIPFLSFSGGNTGMQKANVFMVQYNVIIPSTTSKHASLEVKTDLSQANIYIHCETLTKQTFTQNYNCNHLRNDVKIIPLPKLWAETYSCTWCVHLEKRLEPSNVVSENVLIVWAFLVLYALIPSPITMNSKTKVRPNNKNYMYVICQCVVSRNILWLIIYPSPSKTCTIQQ